MMTGAHLHLKLSFPSETRLVSAQQENETGTVDCFIGIGIGIGIGSSNKWQNQTPHVYYVFLWYLVHLIVSNNFLPNK